MPYVTTLIAPREAPFFDDAPSRVLSASGLALDDRQVLAKDRAVDYVTTMSPARDVMDDIRDRLGIDIMTQDMEKRSKRLFVADMDATMVEEETLDELAAHAGIKDKISAITKRAMNGEIDFKSALRERVGLLKNLPEQALADTADRMTLTPGGKTLLDTLKANGVLCVLVSGGFTFFTQKVAERLGFDRNFGNVLGIDGGRLTGKVAEPIVDKLFKQTVLNDTAAELAIAAHETVAIGDGANDLPMLEAAGLGVGFRGKKILRDALPNHIVHGDLETLIYVLGLNPVR